MEELREIEELGKWRGRWRSGDWEMGDRKVTLGKATKSFLDMLQLSFHSNRKARVRFA
jgi:hypothetical protein